MSLNPIFFFKDLNLWSGPDDTIWLEEGTHCFLLSRGVICASWRIFYCSLRDTFGSTIHLNINI